VDKILKKDMQDPMNGKPLKEKDFIPLQRVCQFGSFGNYFEYSS
jgi:hypothetical protein